MTANSAPTDTRHVHARWAVAVGISIAVVGSVVGVVFGVILGDASGPESWLIIGGFVLSTALLALLFTDVVMPGGLNGAQLAAEARKVRPHIPVLFTSGYTENAILHHGPYDGGVRLLSKPYRLRDLAKKVRAVLDA